MINPSIAAYPSVTIIAQLIVLSKDAAKFDILALLFLCYNKAVMIPIKLTLHNFMCYRGDVPSLSFTGIHTACIAGDNGNGKSALIDAMTWALWGKARSKSDIELIYQGQTEMAVEFDFITAGQIYRIIRKYARPKTRTGSGHPVLEFQIAANGSFRPISGSTVTMTQQKIIDTLHMDYETFINSAFLRQGHADEFTRQPPTRRKEVLGNILGLAQYDRLEERAKEMAKHWEAEAEQLRQTITEYNEELTVKSSCETELVETQTELARIEKSVAELAARVSELKRQRDNLESKKIQLGQLEKHITETQRGLQSWLVQAEKHKAKVKEFEETLAQRIDIEEGYSRFIETKKIVDEANQKLTTLFRLNEHKNRLERAIDQAQNDLITEQTVTRHRIGELNIKIEQLPQLKKEYQQAEAQQHQVVQLEKTLEDKKQFVQDVINRIIQMRADTTRLQTEIKELDEKLLLLSGDSGAKCPLCEQELGVEEHRRIEEKYSGEKKAKAALLSNNQTELARMQGEMSRWNEEIERLDRQVKQERATVQGRLSIIAKSIAEAQESVNKLEEVQEVLSEIEQRLAKREFAVSEQQTLIVMLSEIAGLNYDEAKHSELKQQLSDLAKWDNPQRKLLEAKESFEPEKQALLHAEKAVGELRDSLASDLSQQQILSGELDILPGLEAELSQAQAAHDVRIADVGQAQEAVGRVKEKLQHCIELEVKKDEKEKQLKQGLEQAKIYQELAQAFGKRGVQALLIETAVPEIEIEADRMLSRMTENRMHVKIETQRATKKGDVTETLDINVSDELGTRNYEMFSGGETFRINFAIRIALSRLLARRAGAPLPTLIIDEGFGTQDSSGIERLKEAIISIQDDFEKILVITHIDELKDAFPTRIDVIKTGEGSTISVN